MFKLQAFNWSTSQWDTVEEYDASVDNRAEGNAYFAYQLRSGNSPHRLLKDGVTVLGSDDPNEFYRD